jgi:signal transduction histidine kinase
MANFSGLSAFGDGLFAGYIGSCIDITDLKHAEEELSKALHREQVSAQRLRALDGQKNTFLQAVSHDLRSPLTAIRTAAAL